MEHAVKYSRMLSNKGKKKSLLYILKDVSIRMIA